MTTEGSQFTYEGQLKGHRDWVTALACPSQADSTISVVSSSRDGTLISWVNSTQRTNKDDPIAIPSRQLEGHTGFVQDVALTANGEYALSASWDRSLRLWNLKTGACFRKFLGHTKDALSCAVAPDNRHILSGGRDNKLKLWNVNGDCVYTFDRDAHTDWVSCVRFSPSQNTPPVIVSGSWDCTVKVWSLAEFRCLFTLRGHKSHVNSVTVSPDCSLCASAGKDGIVKLWDLSKGEHLYELESSEPINQIAFCPNRYWLCAATETSIRIWDLEVKEIVAELVPEVPQGSKTKPECTSVAWSHDGSKLYSGFTDNTIRVWGVRDA